MPTNEQIVPEANNILLAVAALSTIKGIGFKTLTGLFDRGILANIWGMSRQEIEKSAGDLIGKHCPRFAEIVTESKSQLIEQGTRACEQMSRDGITFVPRGAPEYPVSLLRLAQPPRWLFVKGNVAALLSPGLIGIVGSREASNEGQRIAYALAKEMVVRNLVVLSGLAKGIDSEAHRGAIDYYGQTIGILGHGFKAAYSSSNDQLWPRIIERDGAIVTEYYLDDPPSRETFLRRNEIQAALSHLIIPVESRDLSSGTGATIRRALAVGTPLVGTFWQSFNTSALSETRDNLKSLGIPVFTLPDQSADFWAYIQSSTKQHDWSGISSVSRQQRFRRIHDTEIAEELRRAGFGEPEISQWTLQLQQNLKNQREKK